MTFFYLTLAKICHTFPSIRKPFWKYVYQRLADQYQQAEWTFMNYGYLPTKEDPIDLQTKDEGDRNLIALYHHVASAVDLTEKEVLEVGSGRGGGASYVARYLSPAEMTGIDISENAITFCRSRHKSENLTFQNGDAESILFDEATFDVVLNVESSHCYGSITRFFAEAYRVLRPGGAFLYADFRPTEDVRGIREALISAGFNTLAEEDITPNVIAALESDSEWKEQWISDLADASLQTTLKTFAATSGTKLFDEFKTGGLSYFRFHAKK